MTDSAETRFKQLLVDAICGVGFPSIVLAQECEKVGMAEFTGTVYEPEWQWSRPALDGLPVSTLQELYEGLADKRDALDNHPATTPEAPRIIVGH